MHYLYVIIIDGMEIDASIKFDNIDYDSVVTHEQYVTALVTLLQPILDQRFPNIRGKQTIRVYKDRISFACPVCGDSMKSNYKKRGNFILTGKYKGFFKCHNCGFSNRIDYFFRDFKIDLNLNVVNYISKGIQEFSSQSNIKYDMSIFLDMDMIDKYAIDRDYLCKHLKLSSIESSHKWIWLKNRLQYNPSNFLYDNKEDSIAILNLTQSGKILGIQKRTSKGVNKYLTYKLSKIYELLNIDPIKIPEEINDISSLFNICLINYTKPIILLEGPLDSFLIKNSIANTGANKNFPLDLPLKYLYDKDETGVKKSIEHINNGDEVFLWDKFIRDFSLPFRKKWDITDCLIYFHDNGIRPPNFNLYFSNNPLDIIDI